MMAEREVFFGRTFFGASPSSSEGDDGNRHSNLNGCCCWKCHCGVNWSFHSILGCGVNRNGLAPSSLGKACFHWTCGCAIRNGEDGVEGVDGEDGEDGVGVYHPCPFPWFGILGHVPFCSGASNLKA